MFPILGEKVALKQPNPKLFQSFTGEIDILFIDFVSFIF